MDTTELLSRRLVKGLDIEISLGDYSPNFFFKNIGHWPEREREYRGP